jgi:hypothetical protein
MFSYPYGSTLLILLLFLRHNTALCHLWSPLPYDFFFLEYNTLRAGDVFNSLSPCGFNGFSSFSFHSHQVILA